MTDLDRAHQGDGVKDCPLCRGRGVVPVPPEMRHSLAVGEVTQPCKCVLFRDILANLNRGWRNLSRVQASADTPLCGKENQNLWITASTVKFKAHLKHVAVRMGTHWNFLVVSDADLMDAWFSRGLAVEDPDISQMRKDQTSSRFVALSDLAIPPTLLIIRLGIKTARNVAMPEVFLEVLSLREQESKPTWIFDQPVQLLEEGHRAFSGQVADYLEDWEHVILESKNSMQELPEGVTPVVNNASAEEAGKDLDPYKGYEDHRLETSNKKGKRGGPR